MEVSMMTYGYIRVSSDKQTVENQRFEIEQFCSKYELTIDSRVTETVSGTVTWEKRSLGRLVRKMKKGDMLICTEISRLGRTVLMIMAILNKCSQKEIHIRTIKDNFDLSDSINSKIITFAFALASEIERNLISQRTKASLESVKASGKRLGRPFAAQSRKLKLSRNTKKS